MIHPTLRILTACVRRLWRPVLLLNRPVPGEVGVGAGRWFYSRGRWEKHCRGSCYHLIPPRPIFYRSLERRIKWDRVRGECCMNRTVTPLSIAKCLALPTERDKNMGQWGTIVLQFLSLKTIMNSKFNYLLRHLFINKLAKKIRTIPIWVLDYLKYFLN